MFVQALPPQLPFQASNLVTCQKGKRKDNFFPREHNRATHHPHYNPHQVLMHWRPTVPPPPIQPSSYSTS